MTNYRLPDLPAHEVLTGLSNLHEYLHDYTGRTNSSSFHKAFKIVSSPNLKGDQQSIDQKRINIKQKKQSHLDVSNEEKELANILAVKQKYDALRTLFRTTYHRFVRNVVAPLLQCEPDEIYYQKQPVIRIVIPATEPVGHKHNDYEYHHQPSEINFWVPLTNTHNTNSLYAETKPNGKDFKPFNCNVNLKEGQGEAMKFWGNQCTHYTVANVEQATRISFDFRCIEKKRFNNDFVDSRGKPSAFKASHYYMDSAGKC